MRNRVALKAARTAAMMSKLVLVMVLIPVALVGAAQGASADTAADGVAAENASFGILGPVGIGAVVLGFGGLIAGLLRHRRREASGAPTTVVIPVETTQPMEPATGERVA